MVITNGFTYIAFLMCLAGCLLLLEKYSKWRIFNVVPALVFIYILNMIFCTMGLFNSEACSKAANMAAMQAALPVDAGAYSCALALDTVCYSVWIALLLLMVRYSSKWDNATKADTSKLQEIADIAAKEVTKEKKTASAADWVFLIGLSLMVSALSQMVGGYLQNAFASVGLEMFDKGTMTTVFVTVLGLVCALTPLGKLPAVEELSTIYLYAVVSLLASTASVVDLLTAPMWLVYGLFILVIHVVLMFVFSKIFHWDLCMVSTASLANIGGSASAPIVASAYNPSYAGIGVLMGVLGAAVGNFFGIGIGQILKMMS